MGMYGKGDRKDDVDPPVTLPTFEADGEHQFLSYVQRGDGFSRVMNSRDLRRLLGALDAEVLRSVLVLPTHYEAIPEADDGDTVCDLCGDPVDGAHALDECVKAIARVIDWGWAVAGAELDRATALDAELRVAREAWRLVPPHEMQLFCPECGKQHLDIGEFATRVHRKHKCENTPEGPNTGCGSLWVPHPFATKGVLRTTQQHLAEAIGELVRLKPA